MTAPTDALTIMIIRSLIRRRSNDADRNKDQRCQFQEKCNQQHRSGQTLLQLSACPWIRDDKLVVVNIDHALDIQTMHPVVLECVVQLSCFKPNASD